MQKLDLTKQYKAYYRATNQPELLEIEKAHFLSITGKGDPSEQQYADKLKALYATAYTLKFKYKAMDKDFVVAKLEGLWSFDEQHYQNISITTAPTLIPRSEWNYRMMIRMPEFVSQEQLDQAVQNVITKKQIDMANEVELFTLNEGKVVQILHIGPFSTEPETLIKLQDFCIKEGLQKNGLHHEIYLSDFNKTAPDQLRTILREPVK
ncbi:GyrI-like domain-containing protein [Pedobacter sp. Hv1]|uniref:GyrI-like domain-containing protein n=1 Tax=Pedobacter sp. Hv1 TaxID=1740090 RepID=UPI0006D8CA4A|nr:GyrI-like domain-containing protein [Pedobacter sp. Hv1]KQC02469.1 hypothetical protein AQF98_02510 [Pedobacter sp. Hv1]